jgi:hypothetical protein
VRNHPLLTLILAAAVLPAWAADGAPTDRRVQKLLESRKLSYEVDDQGDFRVTYLLADGRSQMAIVRSATSSFGSLEVREIVSAGYRSASMALPPEVANRLLELNGRSKLGAWTRQGAMALLVTRVAVDADARELADALEFTAAAADAAERELSGGKDDY